MGDWSIAGLDDAPDIMGDYPGEMHFLGKALDSEQVTLTYRRMPAQTGGKGSYGHRHKTQEELYFVISGKLLFKLEDEIVEVGPKTAVRVGPSVLRSVWNEGPDDVELVICSVTVDDGMDDVETQDGFWPE
jgi:mannose-6-phosphate isomerase-like protein (cupin superfamily)